MTKERRFLDLGRVVVVLALAVLCCGRMSAYSVLTHEEIVDLVWADTMKPLLLARYPGLTPDQLKEAHAYAYGGAVIQDLGYYPFGDKEFSNMVHYVRSGDFVRELIIESQDADEYAFALGALSHYASDIAGHPAVNESVPVEYPKLRAKYGDVVRYAEDRKAHITTEFGFDMVQVEKNRYAPQAYHDFIGFQVSKPLLERVFPVVYGVPLTDVLTHEDLSIGSYRFAVSRLIPSMTRAVLKVHKKDLMREVPNFQRSEFLYRVRRADYEREWGHEYQKPSFGTELLSLLVRIVTFPRPAQGIVFKDPTPQTENLYITSINTTVDNYRAFLQEAGAGAPARPGRDMVLPNCDLDDGALTRPTEYSLTDESYAVLLARLEKDKFAGTTPALKKNILDYYADLSLPFDTKKDAVAWQGVVSNVAELKAYTPVIASAEAN